MNFIVEVGSDANPLSIQSLCHTLERATSQDYAQRQSAGQQLQTWESQPGYYSSLQASIASFEVVRFKIQVLML